MISKKLPAGFSDLENLVERWALPTETQRNRFHLSCSMAEVKDYYDTLLLRAEAIIEHLQALEANGKASGKRLAARYSVRRVMKRPNFIICPLLLVIKLCNTV